MAEGASSRDAVRRRVVVRGRVQGVGFRDAVARRAESRRLTGWVENAADGTVEAVFEGPAAAVEELVRFCEQGPRGAAVEHVEVSEEAPRGLACFEIRGY